MRALSMSAASRASWRRCATLASISLAAFWMAAAAPSADAYELRVSAAADRSGAVPLPGSTLRGDAYVFVAPETGLVQVRFFVDGVLRMTENRAPFDLGGTASDTARTALPFDTTSLADGAPALRAELDTAAGATEILDAPFQVENTARPDQIHLAWTGDPTTTLTVVWRTLQTTTPSQVRYRPAGAADWHTAIGARRASGTAGTLHEVRLAGLAPDTAYEYQVQGDGATLGPVLQARTAPAGPDATFDAIYYADTGLIGRPDGNATGTARGIAEIAAMRPLLTLPGGDYAYFDEDKRFGTLEKTIDEWFNQQQPVLSGAPAMPTYGNHEVLLGENFDAWARRFPTPEGYNGRRNYSFDIGPVHFVSILAVEERTALPAASVTWIENDMTAARARGQRWIVPYMHVSSFADGNTHPANLALRAQLGPLFERLDVDLVLTSHDQSYERTYPLTGVPSAIAATSTSRDCYTQADGVTWAKVSPAGKMSDKIDAFSQWLTVPAPFWTAFRDNTVHHFARLRVSPGRLRLEAYGYVGDGSAPALLDALEYRADGCPGQLAVTPSAVRMSAALGEAAAPATATVRAHSDALVAIGVSDDAPWLDVESSSGETPATLRLSADSAGLAAGVYRATVTITAPGHEDARLPVELTVVAPPPPFGMKVSTSSARTAAVDLQGRVVKGTIYAFLAPETGVSRVRFYIDDPGAVGTPFMTENRAPFDLAGTRTSTGAALPYDTRKLADGRHSIAAVIELVPGGTVVSTTAFDVDNV